MRCPSEGGLRALLAGGGDARVRDHAASCARCAERLGRVRRAALLAQAKLDGLGGEVRGAAVQANAPTGPASVDAAGALRRFKSNIETKERNQAMTEFGKRRSLRPVLAGGVVLAALVAALLISPVRTAAFGLFNVFRVEKFALITVDVSKMPIKMQHDGETVRKGAKPDPNAFGTYSGPLKPQKPREVASLDAASGVVGYEAASAGDSLGGEERSTVYVSEAVKASYTFDVAKIRAKMQESGVRGVKAPEQLDGKTFTFNGGRGVVVLYGAQEDGVVFAQGPSPTLTIPEGVDMDYLRQDFLMIPGLPADLVAQVKEIEDWERTLIIPVPANGSSEEVKVDGSEGVLISDAKGEKNAVLWQRDGRLYAIGGEITAADALEAARRVEYR